MVHPRIDAKARFYCCETSPNALLKHPYDAVYAQPHNSMRCSTPFEMQRLLAHTLSINGLSVTLYEFSSLPGVMSSFGQLL